MIGTSDGAGWGKILVSVTRPCPVLNRARNERAHTRAREF